MPASIELRNVTVDGILHDVNLAIAPGEAVALIGRSGAGKTTALRTMNGLVTPSAGQVLVDDVALGATDLIALRRRTGYIIQGAGLFPHRSVYDNVTAIPRLLGWPDDATRRAAIDIMANVGMPYERFASRYPSSLSGGEQQRVGIARALIARPALLLCDEPFGAVDPIVRRELQDIFIRMRSGVTIVFVTHDLTEALRVCERVVLVDGGRIASDTPSKEFLAQTLPIAQQFVAAAGL